jgi:hypothetical protein
LLRDVERGPAMTAHINRSLISALLVMALALAGCGTTDIITTDPGARIVVNGRPVGLGRGELTQTGAPESSTVMAVTEDGRRQTVVVQRRFTGTTFVLGLFTYGICLLACWQYPDTVFVPLPAGAPPAYGQAAAAPYDPWLQPPPTWQPRAPTPLPSGSPAPGPAAPSSASSPPAPPPPLLPPPPRPQARAASILPRSAAVRTAPFNVAPVVVVLAHGQGLFVEATPNAGWRVATLRDGRVGYIQDAEVQVNSP